MQELINTLHFFSPQTAVYWTIKLLKTVITRNDIFGHFPVFWNGLRALTLYERGRRPITDVVILRSYSNQFLRWIRIEEMEFLG